MQSGCSSRCPCTGSLNTMDIDAPSEEEVVRVCVCVAKPVGDSQRRVLAVLNALYKSD